MGQCYDVTLSLTFNNKPMATEALGKYLDSTLSNYRHQADTAIDELIHVLLRTSSATYYDEKSDEKGTFFYNSAFYETYTWDAIVNEAFEAMVPFLKDGSSLTVYPDNGVYRRLVEQDRLFDSREVEIRNLCLTDLDRVRRMDAESGFNLTQWTEVLDKREKAENCYGAFYRGKLIGYCTLGYADGVIDNANASDGLLSDVYVTEEFRHRTVGSTLIEEAVTNSDMIDGNIYLQCFDEKLQSFYEGVSFESGDEEFLMIRYQ